MEFHSGIWPYFVLSFLNNRWLRVVQDRKSPNECPVNAGVSHESILDPPLFLLYVNDLPYDFICIIAIYTDETIYSGDQV